jgi:4-hydroxy-tetrahydrodipicolinate reductase
MKNYKIWIHGHSGKMGEEIKKQILQGSTFDYVGGSSLKEPLISFKKKPDILIDVTNAEGNQELLRFLEKNEHIEGVSFFLASTGLCADQIERWKKLADIRGCKILLCENTSLGIGLLVQAIKTVVSKLKENQFDIEITEAHHKFKKDLPSGTALFLARSCQKQDNPEPLILRSSESYRKTSEEIGMSVRRGGGIFGEHEVHFISEEEELVFSHRALNRALFAKGALAYAKKLADSKKSRFYFLEAFLDI